MVRLLCEDDEKVSARESGSSNEARTGSGTRERDACRKNPDCAGKLNHAIDADHIACNGRTERRYQAGLIRHHDVGS